MLRCGFLAALALTASVQAQEPTGRPTGDDAGYFSRDTYRIETLICPFRDRIEYEPGEIECGLLQVPENREKPDSRFIELHFVKMHATRDDEEPKVGENGDDAGLAPGVRADPVIYLTGGPGAKAEYYVGRFKDHGIRKHRDLYILEQRGIGTSADFCVNYYTRKPETFNVDTLEKLAAAQRTAATDCARNAIAAGVDVTGYNTIENARDVHALRIALGFGNWNVWGISYGTILGQAYIREDPEGIRAIALDAIVPLDTRADPTHWRVIKWYDRDLRKLDALCAADDDCAAAYPALGDRVREAALAVKNDPIVVEVEDTEQYPAGKAYFQSDIAAFLPFILFYEQSNYPALPAVIHAWSDAVAERDETLFRALALVPGDFFDGSQGMYDAIFCLDGHAEAQVEAIEADRREFPVLTDAFSVAGSDAANAQRCVEVGMPPRDRADYALVETDIPALLIEGDMDPITPPPLAHAIEPGFTNSTYVEFPYAGHGPSRSVDCAGDLLNGFFDDPAAEPDLRCAREMETPDFMVPFYRSSAVPRMIILAEENDEALPVVAAWGGFSTLIVLTGFVVLSIAPIGRRIDKRRVESTGGARIAAWAGSLFGVAALAIFGGAAAVTYEISELLLLFGMVPWARWGAIAALLAGLSGLAALALAVRAGTQRRLPVGTSTGLLLTALATISLTVFLTRFDLGP